MFANSTVVLTGLGAQGQVGEAVAIAFGKLRASLILVGHKELEIQARTAELVQAGYTAKGYPCDLANPDEVASLVQVVKGQHLDGVHALVHMAGGFSMSGPVAESSLEIWNRMLSINLTTAFLATRAFIPLLRKTHGSIVLFAAQPALPGGVGTNMSAYAVAKTGVAALMRTIAAEERANRVRANAIAPSAIRTARNVVEMGRDARFVERESVADVVTFLCSDAARNISGELISLS